MQYITHYIMQPTKLRQFIRLLTLIRKLCLLNPTFNLECLLGCCIKLQLKCV